MERKKIRKKSLVILVVLVIAALIAAFIFLFKSAAFRLQTEKTPITVNAFVDKRKATIGDKIRYTIEVRANKDFKVKFPEFSEKLGIFYIRDYGKWERKWFTKKIYRQWYILDTYSTGKFVVPEAVIKYRTFREKNWHDIKAHEISIEIESVLNKDKNTTQIRDIYGPVLVPGRIPWVWVISVVLPALVVIALYLWLKKRNVREQKKICQKSAHETAYEALNALKRKEYLKYGKFMEYYIELSNIVRRYIEMRFSINAPDMTTEEFLQKVRDDNKLSYEHKRLLRNFLVHCDMVKFAKYEPNENEALLSFESAENFIDQTKEINEKNE